MNINLNELSLDNVGQWPKPIKFSLIGIVFVLIVALGYWLLVRGNLEEYDTLVAKEVELKAKFEIKQAQAASLQAYRNQINIMEERFGKMLQQLPSKNEMPALLEDISKTGVASGLTFELFAPLPEVTHDFYIELPIQIAVEGNYEQFALFLSKVVQMSRIVTLHDFVIEMQTDDVNKKRQSNEPKLAPSGDRLVMKLTAKIYRYRTK